jgi:hypothetical protein
MPSALCEAGAQRLPLSDADRAAIDRALSEAGITLSADVSEAGAKRLLAAILAAGGDDEVRDLIAAGQVAEAIGVARFNAFEREHPFAQRDQVARLRGA